MQTLKTAVCAALCAFALGACDQLQTEQAEAPEAATEEAPAAPAEAARTGPAYVGTWAVNAADCSAPQEAENAPYIFHADGFDQHEAHCTWANVQDISATAWRIAAACQVEGDEASLGWDISVEGDTMQMNPGGRLIRCP